MKEVLVLTLCFGQVKGRQADIPMVLVGNKCDEEAGPREVASTTGETLQVSPRRFRRREKPYMARKRYEAFMYALSQFSAKPESV